jgi:SAM-dependent methyltransferase
VGDIEFRRDLYRGTAWYYDRFRVPYPRGLVDDLAARTGADGAGRLLDLACGTGQISFALHRRFAEVWAVDQEPGMTAVVRAKAGATGARNIRVVTSAAEDLSAPAESFDLVAIGNAFHRLHRAAVAARVLRWLRPGGFLALVWGGSPWEGGAPWQAAMRRVMARWQARSGDAQRVPAGYERDRGQRPDLVVLEETGFRLAGSCQFPGVREWTPEALIGFTYSTSVLSRAALGDLAPGFEEDLRRELRARAPDGRLRQTIQFACELAHRPA